MTTDALDCRSMKGRRPHHMAFLCVLICLSWCAGCMTNSSKIPLLTEPESFRQGIEERLPPGTPLCDAQKVMVDSGFTCQYVTNGSFIAREKVSNVRHSDLDFLKCYRIQRGFLGRRYWSVFFTHEDATIKQTHVFTGSHRLWPDGF